MTKRLLTPLQHALSAPDVSAEGQWGYDSTRKGMMYHDGVRKRFASCVGFMPYAYPIGGGPTQVTTTALAIAANGGNIAIPVVLEGHMLLESVSFWNTDTATARGPVEYGLYEDRLDNANALNLVDSGIFGVGGYTPTIAIARTMPSNNTVVYLPPGQYWLAIKNNHTGNTLGIGVTPAGTMATSTAQTKTLTTAAYGSTLDLVAATWTKIATIPGIRLNGRVFGQSAAF